MGACPASSLQTTQCQRPQRTWPSMELKICLKHYEIFFFCNVIKQLSSVNMVDDSVVFLCQNSGHISPLQVLSHYCSRRHFIIAMSYFSALVLSTKCKPNPDWWASRGLSSKWMTPRQGSWRGQMCAHQAREFAPGVLSENSLPSLMNVWG